MRLARSEFDGFMRRDDFELVRGELDSIIAVWRRFDEVCQAEDTPDGQRLVGWFERGGHLAEIADVLHRCGLATSEIGELIAMVDGRDYGRVKGGTEPDPRSERPGDGDALGSDLLAFFD